MTTRSRSLNDIRDAGISVLTRELGAADTIRFLQQFSSGSGDYTRERKDLLRGVTMDELAAGLDWMKRRQSRASHPRPKGGPVGRR